jgi:hypothetical protein
MEAGRIAGSGAKSPQELARLPTNATTHGPTGRTIILMSECGEELQSLRDAYLAEIEPQSRIESGLVDRLVVTRSRLERVWMTETALLDVEMTRQREGVEEKFEVIDEETLTALAFRYICDGSRTLAALNHYEAASTTSPPAVPSKSFVSSAKTKVCRTKLSIAASATPVTEDGRELPPRRGLQVFFCKTRVTARKCRRISEPKPFSAKDV